MNDSDISFYKALTRANKVNINAALYYLEQVQDGWQGQHFRSELLVSLKLMRSMVARCDKSLEASKLGTAEIILDEGEL